MGNLSSEVINSGLPRAKHEPEFASSATKSIKVRLDFDSVIAVEVNANAAHRSLL